MANLELVTRWFSPNELKELDNAAIPGDLIECDRGVYKHWGVYVGVRRRSKNKQVPCVIHFAGAVDDARNLIAICRSESNMGKSGIVIDRLVDVVLESRVRINNSLDEQWVPGRPSEIIMRAELRMGEDEKYDVVWNNCEHFATFCRYGQKRSCQVQTVVKEAAVGLGLAAAVGLVGAAVWAIFAPEDKPKRRNKQYEEYN